MRPVLACVALVLASLAFAFRAEISEARLMPPGVDDAPAGGPIRLLAWKTFGNAGTETTEPSFENHANIAAADLTLGSITPGANGNRFGGSAWFDTGDTNPTTLAESVTGNDYIQFIVTPNSGFSFTPENLQFVWDRSATGPSSVTLRSSVDSFTADLGSTTGIVSGAFATNTITITGLTNITTATTFRLYGYGATSAAGTGGFDVSTDTVNVILHGTTAAVPVPPTSVAPASVKTSEDTTFNFTGGNALSVADTDSSSLTVTLTATNGTVSLTTVTGLTFSAGDGTADVTMTFSGTIADLNNALATLSYAPTANYNGSANLQFSVTDGATTPVVKNIGITVNAVNDAPFINNPGTIKVGTNATLDTTVVADDDDNNDTLAFSIAASQTCAGTEYTGTIFFTGPTNSITTTPTRSSKTLRVQTTPSTTPGSYVKRLRVSDLADAEGFFCAQITVNFANTPPVWVTANAKVTEPSGADAVPVQRAVSLSVDDVDINQNLLFSLNGGTGNCGGSPTHPFTGFSFTPNPVNTVAGNETTSMQFSVGANAATGSPYCVRVDVTDRDAGNTPFGTVTQDITITVNAANSAPVINDPGTINVNINSTVDTTVFADDADNNETLAFSIAASQTCVGTEYTGTILFTGPTNSITTTPTRSSKTLRIQTSLGTAPGNYVKRIQVSDGTAQGFFCVQITVPASAPTVTTNAASSVTTTGATLNGEANPHGTATTGWFRYSTTSPGTCNDTFGTRAPVGSGGTSLGSGTSSAPFSQGIASLSPNTTYFFCAIAQNSVGTGFGAVLQFTTTGQPPSVTTDSANSITATSANLRGAGNPNGTATTAWFRYSTTNPGTCNDTFGIRVPSTGGTALGSGTSFVLFNQSVGSLAPNTTYYYCAIGGSAQGTGFGALTVFTTLVGPPETQLTGAPPDPTNDSTPTFTFTGSTIAQRTIAGFQCSVNAAPFAACISPHTTTPLADGNYNFQVRAVDDQGTPDPTPEVTFFTIDTVPPTIAYGAVQTNSTADVTFTANVSDNLAVAEVRVFFSLNGGPFNSAVCAAMLAEGAADPYQCTIPGQPSGTAVAYYVRATDTAGNNAFEPPAATPNMYLTGTGGEVPSGTYSTLFLSVGATLGGNVRVEDALIFAASSIVDTGGNTLTLACAATVTGAGPNSYIVGPVEKQFCGLEVFTFPVGTAAGPRPDSPAGASEYSPLTASVRSVGTLHGDPPEGFVHSLTVSVVDDWLPGVVQASGVSRYWSVTETGSVRADLAMTYLDEDINGTEANYKPFRRSGGTTLAFASFANDPGSNTTTAIDVTAFSDWGIGALVPTAADASISGRATDANGGYIRGVRITVAGGTLTAPRTALTNAFGYYSIGGLTAGETYVVTAGSKRYVFQTPSRVVSPGSDLINIDFVAEP